MTTAPLLNLLHHTQLDSDALATSQCLQITRKLWPSMWILLLPFQLSEYVPETIDSTRSFHQ